MIFLYRVYLCSLTCSFSLENVQPLFSGGFLSLYSPFPCISSLHLYISGELYGCLSYQDPLGGGRKSCELWSHCSGIISSLMQLVRLVQSIECEGGRCLLQETSFLHPCTSCTLPFPSISLSLGFLGMPAALRIFNSPQVGIVLGVCLPFFAWVGQICPQIGFLGSRPSHNSPLKPCSLETFWERGFNRSWEHSSCTKCVPTWGHRFTCLVSAPNALVSITLQLLHQVVACPLMFCSAMMIQQSKFLGINEQEIYRLFLLL